MVVASGEGMRKGYDERFIFGALGRVSTALGWSLPKRETTTPIFPLLCGGLEASVQIATKLAQHGIHLRPIRPPTVPAGTERLRATITADLYREDLNEFLGVLREL